MAPAWRTVGAAVAETREFGGTPQRKLSPLTGTGDDESWFRVVSGLSSIVVPAYRFDTGGPMQYMLFIATDSEPDPAGEQNDTIEAWLEEGERRGIRQMGERLRPPEDATTVRVRNGEMLVTDGPFAESKEWIAGFDIIECADLDEAIDYASRHPMAHNGRVEIRPFHLWEE
jgi:hypothetical protein